MSFFSRLVAIAAIVVAIVSGATLAEAAPQARTVIKGVGLFPGDVGVGFGAVWVLDHRGGALYRISPGNKVRRVEVGESLCAAPAFGAGSVWVWGCDTNRTYRIDPKRMKVTGHRQGIGPVFGAGSLWTDDNNGKTLRIDPASGVVLATIPADDSNGGPQGVWAGSLWDAADTTVTRIDVTTNKVTDTIPLPGAQPSGDKPGGYLYANFGVYAFGKFWDSNAAGMYVIDRAKNTAHTIGIPIKAMSQAGDIQVAAGAGSIWVRTSDTTVARIDPTTEKVIATYPAAGGGGGIAVAFNSLWVINAGNGTIWRTPIH